MSLKPELSFRRQLSLKAEILGSPGDDRIATDCRPWRRSARSCPEPPPSTSNPSLARKPTSGSGTACGNSAIRPSSRPTGGGEGLPREGDRPVPRPGHQAHPAAPGHRPRPGSPRPARQRLLPIRHSGRSSPECGGRQSIIAPRPGTDASTAGIPGGSRRNRRAGREGPTAPAAGSALHGWCRAPVSRCSAPGTPTGPEETVGPVLALCQMNKCILPPPQRAHNRPGKIVRMISYWLSPGCGRLRGLCRLLTTGADADRSAAGRPVGAWLWVDCGTHTGGSGPRVPLWPGTRDGRPIPTRRP